MVNLTEDNSSALTGTAITFLVLTYVSVALRTYVRANLTRNFQVDDWLMLVSQVGSLPKPDQRGRHANLRARAFSPYHAPSSFSESKQDWAGITPHFHNTLKSKP
jgi:hypothetical protein